MIAPTLHMSLAHEHRIVCWPAASARNTSGAAYLPPLLSNAAQCTP